MAPRGGIEARQVRDAGLVGQVVERDDLQASRRPTLMQGAQHATTDTAIAVESDAIRSILHGACLVTSRSKAGG